MQTFLPYSDFIETAKCLDYKRLGKQRVEAFQIIKVLEGHGTRNKNGKLAWENHPAVLMWRKNIDALKYYHNCMIEEWVFRGYKNNMKLYDIINFKMPDWLGYKPFHESHRSNLLRKDFNFYSRYNWNVEHNLEYIWVS